MKNEMKILITVLICLAIIPSTVFAFGEVAGSVVIYVSNGGTNVGQWGLFNGNASTAKITATGDAAQYLSFPSEVSLQDNNVISYVPITATIPANADFKDGTNITGVLSALVEGQPGQVQINLQIKKNVFIIIGNPPVGPNPAVTSSNQVSSQSQAAPSTQQTGSLLSGFSFLPAFDFNLVGAIVVGIVIFLAFVFVSRRFGFRQVETKVKPQRRRR